jgi:hypothetical protein
LKQLEEENRRLKQMVADLSLDKAILYVSGLEDLPPAMMEIRTLRSS